MSLYAQMAGASKKLYDQSLASTTAHVKSEKEDMEQAWGESTVEFENYSNNTQQEREDAYTAFSTQREEKLEEMLEDMLTNVIGPVSAAVATLILDDTSFDVKLAQQIADNAGEWAQIGLDEGDVSSDFILV